MSIALHWFLTTAGDGRSIVGGSHMAAGRGVARSSREPDIDYIAQQARAADHLGFSGVLTPTGTWCEDAWLTTAALIRETRQLKFLVAFRPGVMSPTLAAQMAATYQRISRGRLLLNVVTGGDSVEMQRFGDWVDKDERYARTGEFLQVVRGAWSGEPFDFEGRHYKVRGATVSAPPDPVPDIYFGGSSDAALPVAAAHADAYLTWGEPPAQVAEKISRVRDLAQAQGRTLRFGIRLHTISRDTSKDAWREAPGSWTHWTPRRSPARGSSSGPASPSGSSGCSHCTAATATTSRSRRTCGPGSDWCAVERARRLSAATRRSPTGSRSTTTWTSTSSSSAAIRTSRRLVRRERDAAAAGQGSARGRGTNHVGRRREDQHRHENRRRGPARSLVSTVARPLH